MQLNARKYLETVWLQKVTEREPIEIEADSSVNVKLIVNFELHFTGCTGRHLRWWLWWW
jgi:hypothetical protein